MAKTAELFPLKAQPPVLHSSNRYNNHPMYLDPDTRYKFIGSWNPPNIPQKETDIIYEVTSSVAYRPDIIAYEFYETPLLGWVISYVNNITNPLDREDGLYPGRVIRIPDITTITTVLTF